MDYEFGKRKWKTKQEMSIKPEIRVFGTWFGRLTLAESFRKNAVAVPVMNRNNYDNFQSIMYELEVADLGRNLMLR